METSKHTEGEWKVEAKNLIKCNGEQIGSANSMLDEYEANAKLMAASTDILEALIEARKVIRLYETTNVLLLNKIDNAIKKATK